MSLRRKIIDFFMGGPARRIYDDSTSIVPGDMVACVADGWRGAVDADTGAECDETYVDVPRRGNIYIVEDVVVGRCGVIGLVLREFPGSAWHVHAFRKVRRTSIECLRSLLQSSPEKVVAATSSDAPIENASQRFCDVVKSFEAIVSSECLDYSQRLVRISFAEDDGGDDDGEQAGFLPGNPTRNLAARRHRVGGGVPHLSHFSISPEGVRRDDPQIITEGTRDVGRFTRARG